MGAHLEKKSSADGRPKWKIVVELPVDPVTGDRNRYYETFNGPKRDAEKRMREIQAELEGGNFVKKQDITVKEWLNDWHSIHIGKTHSPTTLAGYRNIIDTYLIPQFGSVKLQGLSTTMLQKYYNELHTASPASGNPMAPKTVKNIHVMFKTALNKALKLGLIKNNPALNVEIPKVSRYKAEVYNEEEIQELIEKALGTDMELAIFLLLCLGLRRGELIGLKWVDVNWEKSQITICRSLVLKDGKLTEKPPKTESSNRTIDVPTELMQILKNAHTEYIKEKLRLGAAFDDNGFIIRTEKGTPYQPDSFSQKFKTFLRRNGLKEIRLHDMRHTAATTMLSLGISPKVAQQRLGHSNFSTTMDIYSHILDDVGKEASEKIGEAIFSKIK